MKQPFAVFDIDGTIFRSSLFLELVYRSIKEDVLPTTIIDQVSAERDNWHKRKNSQAYVKYIDKLLEIFMHNIKGVKTEDIQKIAKQVVEELHEYTYVYTRDLLKTLKQDGYFLIAITGSPSEIAKEFGKYYRFDYVHSSSLLSKNGRYTGQGISASKNKAAFLKEIVAAKHLGTKASVAVGDTIGDIGILEFAEKPIAFNPDKKLFEIAKSRCWQVVVERKNMIYSLEARDGSFVLAKTRY